MTYPLGFAWLRLALRRQLRKAQQFCSMLDCHIPTIQSFNCMLKYFLNNFYVVLLLIIVHTNNECANLKVALEIHFYQFKRVAGGVAKFQN